MTRWATFDCYGTLVDWRSGIRRELARLLGDARSEELLVRYYETESDVQRDGALSYRQVLARSLARVAATEGLAVPAEEEDALARSLPAWPVFPDVVASLAEVRARGWRLAILSNTDRDLIDASIAAIGIPFDLAVVASEIGSYKPAPAHWRVFCARAGVAPNRHVHVAQSVFHDVVPARELGIPTVWINRLGEPPLGGSVRELPDLRLLPDTLDELVPV